MPVDAGAAVRARHAVARVGLAAAFANPARVAVADPAGCIAMPVLAVHAFARVGRGAVGAHPPGLTLAHAADVGAGPVAGPVPAAADPDAGGILAEALVQLISVRALADATSALAVRAAAVRNGCAAGASELELERVGPAGSA